jgi:predicted MFS family arabinose efflux permease
MDDDRRMPRALVGLLAVSVGLTAANIWYVTPLLNEIGDDFGASQRSTGLLVTACQGGYVVGLSLMVPLGDLVERRRLITRVLLGTALAAAACAAAPSIALLGAALALLGLTACVTQIVVPLSSALAGPRERGQVVGTVMAGLLVGVLLARTLAGALAELGGWRLVYALSAAAMVALSLVLRRALPPVPPTERMPYGALLRSVLTLVSREPVLRQRMALGALSMAGFSAMWTTAAFLLGDEPYGYGEGVIGLFGLAGVAGALLAPLAGRLTDRGRARRALTAFLAATLAGWALLEPGGTSLGALIGGLIVFDLGVQGTQINNQSTIYALAPQARSRLTTAYMVSYFVGATAGSVGGTVLFGVAGWDGVCALGAALAVAALALWAGTHGVGRPAPAATLKG